MSVQTCQFVRGQAIEFEYPNAEGVYELRRIAVMKVVDLETEPLKDGSHTIGQFMIKAHDLNKHEWRQYYVALMRQPKVLDAPLCRLAVYDPLDSSDEKRYIGSVYFDTPHDRQNAARVIEALQVDLENDEALGLFPWGSW